MPHRSWAMLATLGWLGAGLGGGCAAERANVSFSYVVEPERGLPPGMKTISIEPAVLGPTTDAKWSDLCMRTLQYLVNEAHNRYGADVVLADRIDTQATYDEADLRAAGLSTDTGHKGGKLLAVQGKIIPSINVKVEKTIGKASTISSLDLSGLRGRRLKGGSIDIDTREVTTVSRTMTVQVDFKLVDTVNNRDWEHYASKPYVTTDRTEVSPLFGASQTEAELTPRDRLIASLVERSAKTFIGKLLPCRIDVDVTVVASGNASCVQGVKLLRAEMFGKAVVHFKRALAADRGDHFAAFGAGVAREAMGRYDDALRYYRRACAGKNSRKYQAARDRMKRYASRIRR